MSYGIDFVFVFFRIDSFRDYYVGSESVAETVIS